MQVFVKTLTGSTVTLDVQPEFTVKHLKHLIPNTEGIPAEEQRLVSANVELTDEASLAELDVKDASTVYLVMRLLGGGKKRKKKNYTKPKREKHKRKKIAHYILSYYKIDENGNISRSKKECVDKGCPAATFMAIHSNRYTCGRCGTTLTYLPEGEEKAD